VFTRKQVLSALVLLGFSATLASAAGPTLMVGSVSGKAGSVVNLPIKYEAGSAAVSSLQFTLTLPAGISDVSVVENDAVKSAGKNVTARRAGNTWKIIIFGLNQDAIKTGELLKAAVKIAPGTPEGVLKVSLSEAVYTDPKGQSIKGTSDKKPGQITVTK
jgi:hypothetical protein